MNGQSNRMAADGAIFDQRLFALRSIDLERKRFAAMRACDLCFDRKFHRKIIVPAAHSPLTNTAQALLLSGFPLLAEKMESTYRIFGSTDVPAFWPAYFSSRKQKAPKPGQVV